QNVLIRRIQEEQGARRPIAYPYRPRAFHAGMFDDGRRGALKGGLPHRIREVGAVIYSVQNGFEVESGPQFAPDSVPIALDTPPWNSVRCTARWD
ncbi:MAG: hypothetical protein ACRESY_02400, partial [Steroidobacteraceae bacterium]